MFPQDHLPGEPSLYAHSKVQLDLRVHVVFAIGDLKEGTAWGRIRLTWYLNV